MENTMGQRIAELRKKRGLTQEELAEQLGVSPQAVSKWENDLACPDIMTLPKLADFFNVTIDELLRGEEPSAVRMVPDQERKNPDQMILRVVVNSAKGDRVRVNLPVPLIQVGLEIGMQMPEFSGSDVLKKIDFASILRMIDSGLIGKLVEVDSADGDHVDIFVE